MKQTLIIALLALASCNNSTTGVRSTAPVVDFIGTSDTLHSIETGQYTKWVGDAEPDRETDTFTILTKVQ